MSQFKDWFGRTFNGRRITLLGLKNAGKSQFLRSLGCEDAIPGTDSQREYYKWFKVVYPSKTIYVKAGYDIGGGLDLFRDYFSKAIRNSNYPLFLVDIQKFLEEGDDNDSYQQAVLDRLDYINSHIPRKSLNKIAIILTHADLVHQPEGQLITKFQEVTRKKVFSSLTKCCYPIDARDSIQVLSVFKRIVDYEQCNVDSI